MSSSDGEQLVVVLDAPELGRARPVGVLTRWPGRVLSVGFAYAASWLRAGDAFAIDPSLPLVAFPTTVPGRRLPGVFTDTSPDLWGAALLRRREGRDLDAWGLVTGVADATRMGALRLRTGKDGRFVSDRDQAIPPATSLRELQIAVRRFEDDPDARAMDPAIAQLIAPGSSLGGARPKANYREPDGSLWIAKFPSKTDRRDVGVWEHAYAQLARRAGIEVSDTGVLDVGGQGHAFVTRRFDRTPEGRRLYASALTLSGRETIADADYADIAQAITRWVDPDFVRVDLAQLFRRMAFNVFAGNRDDHLRNHGFLRTAAGWRLAPAFDMNPSREMREHATAVHGRMSGTTAADILAARSHFGLTALGARELIAEVAEVVAGWREVARDAGIARAKVDDVATAFAALASVAELPGA